MTDAMKQKADALRSADNKAATTFAMPTKRDMKIVAGTAAVVIVGTYVGGALCNGFAGMWNWAVYRNSPDIGIKFDNLDEAKQRLKYNGTSLTPEILKAAAAQAVDNFLAKRSPVVTVALPPDPATRMTANNIQPAP